MNFEEIIVRSVGRKPETEAFKFARVIQVQPLRVLIENEDEPVDLPDVPSLEGVVDTGDRLYLHIDKRRVVVIGKRQTVAPTPTPPPPEVGPWKPLTLSSGWSQYGTVSSWGSPEYRIAHGRVEFSGMVTGTLGKDTPIATLPPEAAPHRNRIFSGIENYTPISVQCSTGGLLYANPVRSTPWLSLSSLSYPL